MVVGTKRFVKNAAPLLHLKTQLNRTNDFVPDWMGKLYKIYISSERTASTMAFKLKLAVLSCELPAVSTGSCYFLAAGFQCRRFSLDIIYIFFSLLYPSNLVGVALCGSLASWKGHHHEIIFLGLPCQRCRFCRSWVMNFVIRGISMGCRTLVHCFSYVCNDTKINMAVNQEFSILKLTVN